MDECRVSITGDHLPVEKDDKTYCVTCGKEIVE
jgi:hypothetical protein